MSVSSMIFYLYKIFSKNEFIFVEINISATESEIILENGL
jgi:succinyl-CoA synthetase beta subunit